MLNIKHLNTQNTLSGSHFAGRFSTPILSLLLILAFSFNLSCGKRRPPVPPSPSQRIAQTGFRISQQGNRIALTIPLRNNTVAASAKQVDVFRLAESINSPLFLTEDEFASRSNQVGSIQLKTPQTENEAVFFDSLTPTAQPRRLRYAVRFVNRDDQKSPFSNFIFFEPAANAARPPVFLEPVVSQTAVNLRWQSPSENIDGTQPANVVGYNIYRKSAATEKPLQLNSSLLSTPNFEDKNFKFGEEYEYLVRAVSTGVNGIQVESDDSNVFRISPRDVFPPRAPEGLTIAAAPGNLSVFFAANTETDVIGYNIYRTTTPDLPRERWKKLNDALLTATAFQDAKVESGQRYYYYVRAVDSAGNAGEPSEVVSELAP